VLLAAALLVARSRTLAARTRYAIVFIALLKFAVPSAAVPRFLPWHAQRGTILITVLGPITSAPAAVAPATLWPQRLLALWLFVAAALLLRAIIAARNATRAATAGALPAGAMERRSLQRALQRTAVRRDVALLSSSSILAPLTVGLLRPRIIIPAATTLDPAELETILTHECAHIARHDNLLTLIETLAGCALFFNPLVWIARRVLDTTREEACDAAVAASCDADTYVTALAKICHGALAPHVAGLSCVVNNHVRERMVTIMSFSTRRFLPHTLITAAAAILLLGATVGSGVARAMPAADSKGTAASGVDVSATRVGAHFDFVITVHDREDGHVVQSARVRTAVEQWGTAQQGNSDHNTVVRVMGHADGTATVETQLDGGAPTTSTIVAKTAHAVAKTKDPKGDTISMQLKDAEIHDVLRTFAKLTNTTIIVDDDISAQVDVTVTDVPWTQALEDMLRSKHLRSERVGDTIYVHRE
jgi:beta-lactamase regulating signal transducer with metallopeptidase domain